jgi:hypothetical protein
MVVPCKKIRAKVVGWIAPDRMDVVGVVLDVVVFHQEMWPLKPVVMALPLLEAACPGQMDAVESVLRKPVRMSVSLVVMFISNVDMYQV